MKKLLFAFLLSFGLLSMKAEQTVGEFSNSFFGQNFEIEASQKNGKLEEVYIEVSARGSKTAFIDVKGKELEEFKNSLIQLRDKYLEWVKIAKDNNVTEMNKEFGIKFPSVTIAWHGSKWWFSFGKKPNFKFIILDSGKMVASWSPKVVSSSNEYIDETIYFVFADKEDFNNLINQLDYNTILDKLLKTKNNEDLFQ